LSLNKIFFNRVGFPLPRNYNPADHFILTLAIVPEKEEECRERVKKITAVYENSQECK